MCRVLRRQAAMRAATTPLRASPSAAAAVDKNHRSSSPQARRLSPSKKKERGRRRNGFPGAVGRNSRVGIRPLQHGSVGPTRYSPRRRRPLVGLPPRRRRRRRHSHHGPHLCRLARNSRRAHFPRRPPRLSPSPPTVSIAIVVIMIMILFLFVSKGVRREELNVHVEDGNILQISGERTREEEESTDTWHRSERRRGSFLRRFRLPPESDMDAVCCSLDHGVLKVTVPKKETAPRSIRAVDISAISD